MRVATKRALRALLKSSGVCAAEPDRVARTLVDTGFASRDIQLPGISGMEALQHLRAESDTRDIPVMAVTASAMTLDRQKIMAAGFDAYQTKPLNVREFVEAVRAVLSARGGAAPPA